EAVTAGWHERLAEDDAALLLVGRLVVAVVAARVCAADELARVLRVAAQVPVAAIVALAAVAVEEAILLAVHVVAGNAGLERALVVVAGAGALRVEQVDEAVAVVVHP